MKLTELKSELRMRAQDENGKKAVLVQRLAMVATTAAREKAAREKDVMNVLEHLLMDVSRSTAFRYLLQHGVPGPTWGDREFLPTARRPGRTRQGGASLQLL